MNDTYNNTNQQDILIVDDKPANLHLLSQMLRDQGYNVRAVTSGERALASVQMMPPNLILLDIRMPEMDGYQVCECLKADEKTHEIPIIFISALDEIQDKVKAFQVGGVDYITKPFHLEEVLVRVQTHLSLRQLQKQLQDTNKKIARELVLAGKTQARFMPRNLPDIPKWQFSVAFKPARETSGDFFDVNLLSDNRIGILIADVSDKGVGAALFMALSWALFRAYMDDYPTQPEAVFHEVNRHILSDTDTDDFVTCFFGTLDPKGGMLVYSNAGHSPPLLVKATNPEQITSLARTGPAIGVVESQQWEREVVILQPGDQLVLYTDGITEAVNAYDELFGMDRLARSLKTKLDGTAVSIRDEILADVDRFTSETPQADDIALIVIKREL